MGSDEVVLETESFFDKIFTRLSVLKGSRTISDGSISAFCTPIKHNAFNAVMKTRLQPEEAEAKVKEVLRWYSWPFSWYVWPCSAPRNLESALKSQAFEIRSRCPAMILNADEFTDKHIKTQAEFHSYSEAENLADWLEVFDKVFVMGEGVSRGLRDYFSTDSFSLFDNFSLRLDGKTVACATYFYDDDRAMMANVGVDPQFRKNGFGIELVEQSLRILFDRGIKRIFLCSSPMAHSLYLKLGFKDVSELKIYQCPI